MSSKHRIKFYHPRTLSSLSDSLAKQHHISIKTALRWIDFGQVYVNQKRCREEMLVKPEDTIRVHLKPKRFDGTHQIGWQHVIQQSSYFLIANKPKGLPLHETLDNSKENLKECLQKLTGQELFVTHRLDQLTQGLVILAKSSQAASQLNELFAKNQVTKIYLAKVSKPQPLHTLTHWMESSKKSPKKIFLLRQNKTDKKCVMRILDCKPHMNHYLLKIQLITGRTHQIRAQLKTIGNPLVGDPIYSEAVHNPEFFLQSHRIEFTCPFEKKQQKFRL